MVWASPHRPRRLPAAWVPWEGGFMGGFLAGGRVLHGPVSSPGADPLVSSRPAWWLAARHLVCMLKKMGEAVARVARKVNETVESGSDTLGERGCGLSNHRVPLCGLWNQFRNEIERRGERGSIGVATHHEKCFPASLAAVFSLCVLGPSVRHISDCGLWSQRFEHH